MYSARTDGFILNPVENISGRTIKWVFSDMDAIFRSSISRFDRLSSQ
jgi:hypothetical protein